MGSLHTMLDNDKDHQEEKRGIVQFFPRQRVNCYSQGNQVCCGVKKQRSHASKKWGALMKHSGGWLLFEQHLFVPKHVTLSQKMRLALLVSIPAPCFFDQQAVHDKNSKGDIRGFPNWDWKISKESLSISKHCNKTPHHTKSCFLEPFSSFLHIWSCWHQASHSICQSTTWSREDVIPKRNGTFFFYPKCELLRPRCKHRLPETSTRTLDVP